MRMKAPGGRSSLRQAARSACLQGIWVVKVGGALCEDPPGRARLAQACAALDRPLVVVHGGGAEVSRLQEELGLVPRFVAGRRVSSPADLRAVEMVLSGAVNKALVRDLAAAGRPAAGLSGSDAGLVRCDLVPGLGCVGTPVAVDPSLLLALLELGYVPVLSPVSLGPEGEAVNVNADEVAGALAVALEAERLLLLSDVSGVRVGGEWQVEVASGEVEALIVRRQATGGMVPKLRAAAAATARGVREVHIAAFGGEPLGTVHGTRVRA